MTLYEKELVDFLRSKSQITEDQLSDRGMLDKTTLLKSFSEARKDFDENYFAR